MCRYKADLCFTPMIHSRLFIEEGKYRAENLFNCLCDEDRPLIVQVGYATNLILNHYEMKLWNSGINNYKLLIVLWK